MAPKTQFKAPQIAQQGEGRKTAAPEKTFRYIAKDLDGKTRSGTAQAMDRDALFDQLREQGLYLQSAVALGSERQQKMLKPKVLGELCRQLSTLLAAGVSLVRALDMISKEDGLSPKLRQLYGSVLSEVRKGASLSDAMEAQGAFPPLMLGMLRAGEGTGSLDKVTERLANHFEKEHQMNQQVTSALVYPAVLGVLAVAVVIIIVTFVLPQFQDLFSTMDQLPKVTMILMAVSNFLTSRWYVMLAIVLVLVILVRTLLRVPDIRLAVDRTKLRMPVFGPLNRIICTARFARTISSLYASGMPMVTALQTAKGTIGNAYLFSQFDDVLADLRSGVHLSAALDKVDGFQKKLSSTIRVGEETGRLDVMLDQIADAMEYDAEQATKRMMTVLEPMLIVIMAVVVGFIMVAVMSPILGSYAAIEGSA